MKFTNILYKNKRIEGNDSKLVDILTSSVLQNKNHFLSTNNRMLTNLEKVSTQILQSYFGNIQVSVKKEGTKRYVSTNVLISSPIYNQSNNKVNITLFYYHKNNQMEILSQEKLQELCKTLSLIFHKEVHIEMIRVHYPYMNSQILAQYLVNNASKKNFLKFSDAILTYPSLKAGVYGKAGEEDSFILSSYIQNIRLELSGRLVTEKVVPRVTKKIAQIANPNADSGVYLLEAGLSNDTVENVVVDYGKVTSKNELGSFTLKVWITSVISIFK